MHYLSGRGGIKEQQTKSDLLIPAGAQCSTEGFLRRNVSQSPDDAEGLHLHIPCCSLHLWVAFKSFSIFQVDHQHGYVQNERHFLANGNLLGFAVYLENAAERLPLPAS